MVINKFLIGFILLYFIFIITTIYSYKEDNSNASKIGFVYEENVQVEQFLKQYEFYNENIYTVVKYENIENLKKAVAKNTIDCGYILPKDFKDTPITYLYSNKTVTGTYNNILIHSIYLQSIVDDIGYEVIENEVKNTLQLNEKNIKEQLIQSNDEYLKDAPFLHYKYVGVNGNVVKENIGVYIILYGIVGLFLTLFALSFYLEEVFEKNYLIYSSLKNIKSRLTYYLGSLSTYFVILCFFGIINIAIIKLSFLNDFINIGEIFTIIIFTLCIASLIFTLTLIKNTNSSSLIILVYFISACIFGNIFIEINMFIKYFYPTYYFKDSLLNVNSNNISFYILILSTVSINVLNYFIIKNNKRLGK